MSQRNIPIDNPASALNKDLAKDSRKRREKLASHVEARRAVGTTRRNDLLPPLEVVQRSLVMLRTPTRNVRKCEPSHVAEVADSIASFGFSCPVLITSDNEIVDGVVTVEAAKSLALAEIPCIVIGHLTNSELKRLRVALNRLGEKGAFDLPVLRLVFEEIEIEDEVVIIPGFDVAEIDLLLNYDEPSIDEKANASADPEFTADMTAVTALGDLFYLGEHRLFCGDACDPASYRRLFTDGEEARIILTDPPYGCAIEGFVGGKGNIHHREFVNGSSNLSAEALETFLEAFMRAAISVLMPGGLMYSFMDWRGMGALLYVGHKIGLTLNNILIWNKGRGGMGGLYRNAHELIGLFKNGSEPHLDQVKLGKHGRDRTNVLTYPGATTIGSSARDALSIHPTPKSVELIADLMLDTTNPGEIVLDPFAGSGTIFIAAHKVRRRAYGIELDPLYIDAAIKRFEKFRKRDAIHAASGKTFSELAKIRAGDNPNTLNSETCATSVEATLASPTAAALKGSQNPPKDDANS